MKKTGQATILSLAEGGKDQSLNELIRSFPAKEVDKVRWARSSLHFAESLCIMSLRNAHFYLLSTFRLS